MLCHKCKYNNCKSDACLSCTLEEQYSYPYQQYIFDGYDAPEQEQTPQDYCTNLPPDIEDKLRIALCNIFNLPPLELLCLQAIMQGKSLIQFARDTEKLCRDNNKPFSRNHAFWLRQHILKKYPSFKIALTTKGQRRELKG